MDQGLPDYDVLGWESKKAQQLRFDMLLDSVSLDGKTLLDIGCGMGNLLEYLNSKGISVKYTGADILKSMIEYAVCKRLNGEFCNVDVFDDGLFADRSFDIVYASGIFNLNLGNNREFLLKAVRKMILMANEAVVFNLLHKDSPDREDRYFYYDPKEVRTLLKDIQGIGKVIIKEQYLNNDFTVVCFMKDRIKNHQKKI
ncbi:MAG: methyltransferase domain-containing protein [Ruminiclostridium sp.]|nr:methyltransferase domain-containing protein [Ruminiclostridium sp.]